MKQIEIVEVGARDGLQNEKIHFDTGSKLALINKAIAAGCKRLEVASFVHPVKVPQMADAESVVAALEDLKDITYIGLILNQRGLYRALETRSGGKRGIDEIGAVVSVTDGFAKANQGQTALESVTVAGDIIHQAKAEGLSAQVTISVAWGCPFQGRVSPQHVIDTAKRLADFAPCEIALADTIGVAVPAKVTDMIGAVRQAVPDIPLRAHFHNTRSTGIANAWAAVQSGIRILDASLGGLGGCPFAPKATGNIATEDLVYMLSETGIETGLSITHLIQASHWLTTQLGRPVPSMVAHAGPFPLGHSL